MSTVRNPGFLGTTPAGTWVSDDLAPILFADIGPDDRRLAEDLQPVLSQLRPHVTAESLRAVYAEGYPQGLRFTGAYSDTTCVAVAGWRIVATTFWTRKLTVDDLVVAVEARSRGIGSALLAELEQRARAADCRMIDLDSSVQRHGAHRFYARERMPILAFHFGKEL